MRKKYYLLVVLFCVFILLFLHYRCCKKIFYPSPNFQWTMKHHVNLKMSKKMKKLMVRRKSIIFKFLFSSRCFFVNFPSFFIVYRFCLVEQLKVERLQKLMDATKVKTFHNKHLQQLTGLIKLFLSLKELFNVI